MSFFNFSPDAKASSLEGGEPSQKALPGARYRHKANFNQPRSSKLNANHLYCARLVKIVLVILNVMLNVPIFLSNHNNPLWALGFYSLWGSTFALVSLIFSIVACHREGWFRTAYITTEISYAVNWVILILFWGILVPVGFARAEEAGEPIPVIGLVYQACLHLIPWLTTVTELAMTDMALEKSHTWIAFVVMCPIYMFFHWFVAIFVLEDNPKGTIYNQGEEWRTAPGQTIGMFILAGIAQALIFYISCVVIDYCWPKRVEEYFDHKENLIDEEDQKQSNALN